MSYYLMHYPRNLLMFSVAVWTTTWLSANVNNNKQVWSGCYGRLCFKHFILCNVHKCLMKQASSSCPFYRSQQHYIARCQIQNKQVAYQDIDPSNQIPKLAAGRKYSTQYNADVQKINTREFLSSSIWGISLAYKD